jgi:hypothetical protein
MSDLLIFSNFDLSGELEVCVVATKLDYFQLEKKAQRRGKTVEQFLYAEMAHQLRAYGLDVAPDRFYVTTEQPDEIDNGARPLASPVTMQ